MDYLPIANNTECRSSSQGSRAGFTRHGFVKQNQGGFTLVEALVSLFVLTIGIVPILAVGFSSRHFAEIVEHNLVAINLAQEGVEIVRGIRDSNWVAGAPFDTGLAGDDYEATWDSTALTTAYAGRFLNLSPGGLYSYGAGTPTILQRQISITKVSPAELKVIVNVFWKERGVSKALELEDHLFNWR